MSGSSFFDALSDPGIDALLGMTAGFGNAAMPTRMPTPLGAVLAQGATGALQGARQGQQMQLGQQQLQQAKMQNQLAQSSLPMRLAKNQMMTNLWSHPDQIQAMMNGGTPMGTPGVAAPSATPPMPAPAMFAGPGVPTGISAPAKPPVASAPLPAAASGPVASPTDTVQNAFASLPDDNARKMAANAAFKAGLPAEAIPAWMATVQHESGWDPSVKDGSSGEIGMGQVMPATGQGLGYTPDQLRDPLSNLTASAQYFGQKWKEANGAAPGAFAGYNTGSVTGSAPDYIKKSSDILTGYGVTPAAGGGGVTPQNAAAMAQDYENRANDLERQQAGAKFWQSQGMPVFAPAGDPAALRAAAKSYRDLALAGPTASATEGAKADVEMRTAGPIAAQKAHAELPFTLAAKGFSLSPDGGMVPIKGGMADPQYVGAKAAAEAQASVGADLAKKGFTVGQDGSIAPIKGGPADPAYIGGAKSAEANAEAQASRSKLITTRSGVVDPTQVDPETGGAKEIYRQPEYHEVTDAHGREFPAYVQPGPNGKLIVTGGPPNQNGQTPTVKLGPGEEDTIKHLADQYANEDKAKYEGATNANFQLDQQDQNIRNLNAGGGMNWAATGSGANARAEWAKDINSAFSVLGIKPQFDPTKVASWEEASKIQTQLAFAQAKTLGSHEAAQVVKMSAAATPGAENTPQGYQAISSGLHEMNNRESDLYNFKTQWMQQNGGDLRNAEATFNQHFTPTMYANRAISTVHPFKITAQDQAGAMKQMGQYLPGTVVTLPNGRNTVVPSRDGAPGIPSYVQNYLSAPNG